MHTFSSFTGSGRLKPCTQCSNYDDHLYLISGLNFAVAGKDLEAEREMESNLEWQDRVDKWKARQEKKGLMNKDDEGNIDDQDNEDYEL